MYILGISAYYHDSAATLIKNGKVVCAFEEERFSRIKHDNSFPFLAIQHCLEYQSITIHQIDKIAYYEKPLLKLERVLETYVHTFPHSIGSFITHIPELLGSKLTVEETIRKKLEYKGPVYFVPHHYSHAASVYYTSPFKQAGIATIDGVGEYQSTGLWLGKENSISPISQINFPHSIGLLYSTITAFLGFRVNNDEYKMMGLSSYGKPLYLKKLNKMVKIEKDGSFLLDMDYFSFEYGKKMWSNHLESLLGKSRNENEPILKRHINIASSIQKFTEQLIFLLLNHLFEETKIPNLVISGGVALNSLANGKIAKNTPFKNIYILGPSGDSGASLGSALFTYQTLNNNCARRTSLSILSLGNKYSNNDIEQELAIRKLHYMKLPKEALIENTAELLVQNKIVGWFQGRMEFGPRALGNRSILANPQSKTMKQRVNQIKKREQYRPFAGSVLEEQVRKLFILPTNQHSYPFMNFCFPVRRTALHKIAAIVHVDGTCRIQTVNIHNNDIYYQLIKSFYQKTGIPCLLNTSFNLSHESIVENPAQAIEDYLKTSMDALIIGNFIIRKN